MVLSDQVVVLCFVLVLGSLVPCLPELSATSHMVKSSPLPSADVYTTSQGTSAPPPRPFISHIALCVRPVEKSPTFQMR